MAMEELGIWKLNIEEVVLCFTRKNTRCLRFWMCYYVGRCYRLTHGESSISYQERSLLIRVCTVDVSLLLSCSEYLHQVLVSPVTHWVEYQLIFKMIIKQFGPKTIVFQVWTLTTIMKVKFLSLITLKATSRVYLTRTNTKNIRLTFLQWTVKLKRGEKSNT